MLETDLAGVRMRSPIVLASGTCGFGREIDELGCLSRLGGICSKGLTLAPRAGNAGVRLHETPSGLLNSIGLENPGVERFIADELPNMRRLGPAVIVNLGGHCEEDYIKGVEMLDAHDFDMLELNISCPNVKQGGMSFGVRADAARSVVRAVRRACSKKLCVKLTPNADDVAAVARACAEEGADAVTLVNTFLGMAIDVYRRRPIFDNTYAGLSGPAVHPIALRIVHQTARSLDIPIMAAGGVSTWRDAVEFIMAGASAVQVGTATLVRPDAALMVQEGIEGFMRDQKIESLEEIRGAAL